MDAAVTSEMCCLHHKCVRLPFSDHLHTPSHFRITIQHLKWVGTVVVLNEVGWGWVAKWTGLPLFVSSCAIGVLHRIIIFTMVLHKIFIWDILSIYILCRATFRGAFSAELLCIPTYLVQTPLPPGGGELGNIWYWC